MFVETMVLSRIDERKAPTSYDYRDCKTILKDFHIKAAIPCFETVRQLQQWQSQQIRLKLE